MTERASRAVEAALVWLRTRDAPEAAIAAHEAGRDPSPEDARRWVRWIVDRERNGAWDSELPATLRSLQVLRELREAASLQEQDPAIGRALDWVRGRQGMAGAWTDGCSPARHRQGFCHHFTAGFFSPAAPDAILGGLDLPSGVRTAGEAETRFALSAGALRCVLLWRGPGTDDRLHLEALGRMVAVWSEARPEGLTTNGLLAAIHALLASPDPADRDAAARGLRTVAETQRGDGSWVDADPFHALDVFGEAAAAGVGGEQVQTTVDYGARLLVAAQHGDGSWGPEHGPRRALIAVRTLRRSGPPTAG